MEKNWTTGSVLQSIWRFSLPYLLSYFLQTLYGMADLLIIGRFGTVADTTAVSVGSQVMHMLTVMLLGLAMGTTVCIGQAVGAGDRRRAGRFTGNTITLFFGLSLVLTVILLILRHTLVGLVSTPAEAVEGTVAYLTVCFLGVPFITAYNIISAIFRGMGDSKRPMYFIAVACGVNIVLDYLFMGAFHLGPVGAALGTTLSQAVSVGVSFLMMKMRLVVWQLCLVHLLLWQFLIFHLMVQLLVLKLLILTENISSIQLLQKKRLQVWNFLLLETLMPLTWLSLGQRNCQKK